MAIRRPSVFPKKWPEQFTFLKSPKSIVVHLAFKTNDDRALPLCGVWCRESAKPVLPEQLTTGNLRWCKLCYEEFGEDPDFWETRVVSRLGFVDLRPCKLEKQ